MNIASIKYNDIANGVGVRTTVFVSGCTNKCPGCFQPQTWDFNFGELYDEEKETFIMEELKKTYYKGITILGGEPFEEVNQRGIIPLIRRIKKELPGRGVLLDFVYNYH